MSEPFNEPSNVEESTNQPIARRQFDRVQVAIFRRQSDRDDTQREWYQVTISRSYLDRNREWQRTSSFTERDLPHVKLAMDWAMSELLTMGD